MMYTRLIALLAACSMLLVACGQTEEESASSDSETEVDADTGSDDQPAEDSAEDSAGPQGELSFGTIVPLETLDPHMANAGFWLPYIEATYDTLLRRDTDLSLMPGLATDWNYVDDDGLVLRMEIREGVQFHDGESLDANAVRASLERGMSLEGPMTSQLDPIDEVEVLGDFEIEIRLNEPSPTLLLDLASLMGAVISPAAVENDDLATNPVGSGPWTYNADESLPGDNYVYDVFGKYWDPSVQGVERVTIFEMPNEDARLNALLSGQHDFAYIFAGQAEQAEAAGMQVSGTPDRQWTVTIFDRDGEMVPELADVRVRQAMNHAINRQAIVDAIFFGVGEPGHQIFPPGSMAHSVEAEGVYDFDPDRARELLEEAGVDGFSFEVPILPTYQAWAEAWQAMLADVGIDAQLDVIEPGTLTSSNMSGDYPVGALGIGEPHPYGEALRWLVADAPLNPLGTEDETVRRLVDEAAAANISEEERANIWQELSLYLTEEAWFMPTHFTDILIAYDPDQIDGIQHTLSEPMPKLWGISVTD